MSYKRSDYYKDTNSDFCMISDSSKSNKSRIGKRKKRKNRNKEIFISSELSKAFDTSARELSESFSRNTNSDNHNDNDNDNKEIDISNDNNSNKVKKIIKPKNTNNESNKCECNLIKKDICKILNMIKLLDSEIKTIEKGKREIRSISEPRLNLGEIRSKLNKMDNSLASLKDIVYRK